MATRKRGSVLIGRGNKRSERELKGRTNRGKIKLYEEFCFRFGGKLEPELLELGEAERRF